MLSGNCGEKDVGRRLCRKDCVEGDGDCEAMWALEEGVGEGGCGWVMTGSVTSVQLTSAALYLSG